MSEPTSQQLCESLMRVVGQVAARKLLQCMEAVAEDSRKERDLVIGSLMLAQAALRSGVARDALIHVNDALTVLTDKSR